MAKIGFQRASSGPDRTFGAETLSPRSVEFFHEITGSSARSSTQNLRCKKGPTWLVGPLGVARHTRASTNSVAGAESEIRTRALCENRGRSVCGDRHDERRLSVGAHAWCIRHLATSMPRAEASARTGAQGRRCGASNPSGAAPRGKEPRRLVSSSPLGIGSG